VSGHINDDTWVFLPPSAVNVILMPYGDSINKFAANMQQNDETFFNICVQIPSLQQKRTPGQAFPV